MIYHSTFFNPAPSFVAITTEIYIYQVQRKTCSMVFAILLAFVK